ncbi:MAG: PAS domain S-box protein [Chloroflexota bacterium]
MAPAAPQVAEPGSRARLARALQARRNRRLLLGTAIAMVLLGLVHQITEGLDSEALEYLLEALVVGGLIAWALVTQETNDERAQAAVDAAEESARRFRAMADQGQDISFRYRLDPPGFEYTSPSWETVAGVPAETVLRDRDAAMALIEPADLPALARVMREGTQPGHPVVVRVRRANGEQRIAEFQSTLLRDASGRPTHTVGIGRDVTERVASEARVSDSEIRFRLLAEQSQDIVYAWRLTDPPTPTYLNPAFERITGIPVERALREGLPLMASQLSATDRASVTAAILHGTDPGSPIRFSVRRADGTTRILEGNMTVVPDGDGPPGRCVGSARDITEQVEAQERLQANEARLRELADRSPDILFRLRLRPEPRFEFLSAGAARILGGRDLADYDRDPGLIERTVHPEDRFLLASLLTGTVPSDPVVVRWVDDAGEVTYVEVTTSPLLGPDGIPEAIHGIARVVTERMRAQQALARSEERFRLLAERSRDVIFRYQVRPELRLDYLSPSIRSMTGYPAERFVEDPELAFRILEPADLPALAAALQEGTPEDAPVLVHWRREDGAVAVAEVSAVPVRDRSGIVVATECVARDVTARVAAEEARGRSEARFRAMLSALPMLGAILDLDGRIAFANDAVGALAAQPPEALVGRELVELFARPDEQGRARALVRRVLAGETITERELTVTAADGTPHLVRWTPWLLHDLEGRPNALAVIAEDLTDARRAANERDQLLAAFLSTPDRIAIVDRRGRVRALNRSMADALGVDAADVVGRPAVEVLPPVIDPPWDAVASTGDGPDGDADPLAPRRAEHRSTAPDGTLSVEELVISPVVGPDGTVEQWVAHLRDLSRVHELELAVDQAARTRRAVGAALRAIDRGDDLAGTAGAIVRELQELPGVDGAAVLAFDRAEGGDVIAVAGIPGMTAGDHAPAGPVGHLKDLLADGVFTERWTPLHPHSRSLRLEHPMLAVACGPLTAEGRLVGMLMVATSNPDAVDAVLADRSTVEEVSAIASALIGPALRAVQEAAAQRSRMERIIEERRFVVQLAPIVELATGTPVGFRAGCRFLDGGPAERIRAEAVALGMGDELEAVLAEVAVGDARVLPPAAWLAVRLSPARLRTDADLRRSLVEAGRPMVLELAEADLAEAYPALRAAATALPERIRVAVTGAGMGAGNLAHLVDLRPRYVTLAAPLVADVENDPIHQATITGILQFCAAAGTRVVAEGVTTDAQVQTLRRLGVTFGHGPHFGEPAPAGAWQPGRATGDAPADA